MKIKRLVFCILGVLSIQIAIAQSKAPDFKFKESPRTHNMHIVSDGKFYYANNGGKSTEGVIHKFDFKGNLIGTYDIYLDMRALMYNQKDKHLYVCTYDKKIYKITDLEKGYKEEIISDMYANEQATLAMSSNGKYIYCLDNGVVNVYKFPSGKLSKSFNNISSGSTLQTGSAAIATDNKYFYTWNADLGIIFVYNLKGKKIKSYDIQEGHYGFSLSVANGMVFVSDDGDYNEGTWYGYNLWK